MTLWRFFLQLTLCGAAEPYLGFIFINFIGGVTTRERLLVFASAPGVTLPPPSRVLFCSPLRVSRRAFITARMNGVSFVASPSQRQRAFFRAPTLDDVLSGLPVAVGGKLGDTVEYDTQSFDHNIRALINSRSDSLSVPPPLTLHVADASFKSKHKLLVSSFPLFGVSSEGRELPSGIETGSLTKRIMEGSYYVVLLFMVSVAR